MDPNAALKHLRELVAEWESASDLDIARKADMLDDFIEHFDGLDSWLSHGGFLPRNWER